MSAFKMLARLRTSLGTLSRSRQSRAVTQEAADTHEARALDGRALLTLAAQHTSNTFVFRIAEFAFPLFFITIFRDSLLLPSIFGLVTTLLAVVLSGSAGALIDKWRGQKLRVIRAYLITQKLALAVTCIFFLILFQSDKSQFPLNAFSSGLFSLVTISGCVSVLANVGISIGVERDWVTTIAQGSQPRLTRLNAIMRRIDLLSKLLAPLIVALFTIKAGYRNTSIVLAALSLLTCAFELWWIGIVYNRFAVLKDDQDRAREQADEGNGSGTLLSSGGVEVLFGAEPRKALRFIATKFVDIVRRQYQVWKDFVRMPVFITSLSISLLYMSVLSFDSAFIAYLKSQTTDTDAFIAGMRVVCVFAGLLGTFVSPYLTAQIGLARTGAWSIWQETIALVPTLVSLHVDNVAKKQPSWNTALLFSGLAMSRIGLWSFDLAQLAQIQTALSQHPQKNELMGLQFALQNALDVLHYVLTIIWSRPSQFVHAADVSFAAVSLAAILYSAIYLRLNRGHVLHPEWITSALGLRKNV